MSLTATATCFYCSNPINRATQPHIHATIKHIYKNGGEHVSDRNLHLTCFDKFEELGGRPYNPYTRYLTLDSEMVNGSSDMAA